MITALINRRLWLWKNRLVPSLFLLLLFPIIVFTMISLPLKNIIRFSLAGVPFDIWVFPGLLFIINSFILFPLIYREYFELRIHRKVLINMSLTPHSKTTIIFSSMVVSTLEAFIVVFFSTIVYMSFISISINIADFLFFVFCLTVFSFLLGSLYISLSLIIDTLTTMLLSIFMVMFVILFGTGFLIEFSFFPLGLDSILKWSPISIPFQIYKKFNSTGIIDYISISISLILIYAWVIFNSYLLKIKLRQ